MSDAVRRLLVTCVLLVCLVALDVIPLSGIDHASLQSWSLAALAPMQRRAFAVGLVGAAPWLYAMVLVELACLFWRPWRPLRVHPAGRAAMARTVRYVWLGLAAVQAFFFAVGLESMRVGATMVVPHPGWEFRIVTVLTLVTGSALVGMLCRWSATRGLGAGFTLALLLMPSQELALWALSVRIGDVPLRMPALVVAAAVVLLATRPPGRTVPLSVAGMVPLGLATTLASAFHIYQQSVLMLIVVALSVALALAFQMPDLVARIQQVPETVVRRDLSLGIAVNTAFLVALLWGVMEQGFPGFGYGLVFAVALLWDLGEELRARGRGPLEVAWQLHRLYALQPALDALDAAGIDAAQRGKRTRSLLHALGPFVPVDILVAPERVAEAQRILHPLLTGEPGLHERDRPISRSTPAPRRWRGP